jgi:excisionase family DNA binding protein
MVMTEERLLTVDQVADRLQVTPATVRDWLRAGKIRGMRIGATRAGWRVRESEIQRFIEAAERGELAED